MIRPYVVVEAFFYETHRVHGGSTQNYRLAKAAKNKAVANNCHVLYGVYRDDLGRLHTYFFEVNDEELDMLASLAMSVKGLLIHAMHS